MWFIISGIAFMLSALFLDIALRGKEGAMFLGGAAIFIIGIGKVISG